MDANCGVPFMKCSTSNLASVLDEIGGHTVAVHFRTTSDPKEIASDLRKFSKRLATLSANWHVGEWQIEVINGFPQPAQRMCTLTRIV